MPFTHPYNPHLSSVLTNMASKMSSSEVKLPLITTLLHPIFVLHFFIVVVPYVFTICGLGGHINTSRGIEPSEAGYGVRIAEIWAEFDVHEQPLAAFVFVFVLVVLQAVLYMQVLQSREREVKAKQGQASREEKEKAVEERTRKTSARIERDRETARLRKDESRMLEERLKTVKEKIAMVKMESQHAQPDGRETEATIVQT